MRYLLIFSIILLSKIAPAQCIINTYYETCNYNNGYFSLQCPCDSAIWSNGTHGYICYASPGSYSVTVYSGGQSYTMNASMFSEEWQIQISLTGNALYINAELHGTCTLMYTHPSCGPTQPNYAYDVVIWEDSIPVDTLHLSCYNTSGFYSFPTPGHHYDASVNVCCLSATWGYNPPRTFYYNLTNIAEADKEAKITSSNGFIKIKLPGQHYFKAEIIDLNGKVISVSDDQSGYGEINIKNLAGGIYFVKVFYEGTTKVYKINV